MEALADRSLRRDDRPWASPSVLRARAAAFLDGCDPAGFARSVAEARPWATAGALWDALAASTPLDELADYGRDPARNTMPDGHVQTQQEHSVELVEGLLALRRGDVGFFAARAAEPLSDDALSFLGALAGWVLAAPSDVVRSLLLGGAFHDCGKLVGDVPGVDAENGVALYRRLLATGGVAAPYSSVGAAVVRFHDLVRDHRHDGMLDVLAAGSEAVGAAGVDVAWALAAVQVAGRASIGHRRLDSATVTAMADLVGRWPGRAGPPAGVHVTIVHGLDGLATATTPRPSTTVDHVVEVDEPVAAPPVTLLNGAPCRFEP